jgi:hypothetical protein
MSDEDDMTAVFHAMAHETRRRIMDVLKARPGIGVGELASGFDVTRIAVMNHIAVLEQMINDRWLDDFSGHWARRLTGIKYAAEAAAGKPKKGQGG